MPVTNLELCAKEVAIPIGSALQTTYRRLDLADAYAIELPENADRDPERLARFIFSNQPGWAKGLMKLRDGVVGKFGIKTSTELAQSAGERIGPFRICERHAGAIVLGEEDSHLDFRLSVSCRSNAPESNERNAVVLSTVVQCNNLVGHVYLAAITPFHRMIAKAVLERAARLSWPVAVG